MLLNELEGISEAIVDNEMNSVTFDYTDESQVKIVEEKLSRLGYPIELGVMNYELWIMN